MNIDIDKIKTIEQAEITKLYLEQCILLEKDEQKIKIMKEKQMELINLFPDIFLI